MASSLISWPFRLAPNGSVVTRPDNTAEYYAEEITQLVTTRSGERPLVPQFGLDDPTFSFVDPQELAIKCDKFLIPVRILDVSTKQITDGQQDALVTFTPIDNANQTAVRVNLTDLGV